MLREEFGIGFDQKSVELEVHTKGRDNRELIIESLIRDTNESLNKRLSEKVTVDRFIGSFFDQQIHKWDLECNVYL